MGSDDMQAIVEQLVARARNDDVLARILASLAREDAGADPFAQPPRQALGITRQLNSRRAQRHRHELLVDALTTSAVVELIHSMSDRRAVDRRRSRGKLLGIKVGNTTYHPGWQFDRRAGETRPGLDHVLGALSEVTADPLSAHALMMTPHPDLAGRALAELFADSEVDKVVSLIKRAGDQS